MAQVFDLNFGDALLIVDMQNDFLPGGALAVPDSDRIIPVINAYIEKFRQRELPIYATRDWHPADHGSFLGQGGKWPEHCVAGSRGAEFPAALLLPDSVQLVSKGVDKRIDGYSAFSATDLHARLENAGIGCLCVCGVATDYCVLHTALDALRLDYRLFLLKDAIRAVNVNPGDGQEAFNTMLAKGAEPLILDMIP